MAKFLFNTSLLLFGLLLLAGCVSSRMMETQNAVCQILIRDPSPIEQFIHPQAGAVLDANMCRMGEDSYVVFFNKNHDTAVAYDLDSFRNSRLEIRNYGFGTLQSSGYWSLFHTNPDGGCFESQGGLWTLNEIDEAMRKCAKERRPIRFNWPATNAIDL
ncbi:MAG: hypothetical protein ACREFR_20145 [Limisphaerales bacterium]